MLGNLELLRALLAAGVDHEKAAAAAAILADQEKRLNRLEGLTKIAGQVPVAVCLVLLFVCGLLFLRVVSAGLHG
jgi:hypothetical protein